MLQGKAQAGVNAVVWIMSPDDAEERQSTAQVLAFLEPFLQAMQIPFFKFEPTSAAELIQILSVLETKSKAGLRPIIHIDTHGGQRDGIYIAASQEFVGWKDFADALRPINVATANNLCVVSAACFSLHTIMNIEIKKATPFFLMFAPQHEVTFGFVERNTHNFYEHVFTSHDIMEARELHLAPYFQQYHCQRLLLKSLSGYMRDSCIGKAGRKRVQRLVKENTNPGDPPQIRKLARQTARNLIKPSQTLIDRYAQPFLMNNSIAISFNEIIEFVRRDAMERNVRIRRAARAKRRNNRARHARRKHLRALARR